MSSTPSNHTLLGGHAGALTWLQRFMDLLPPAPASPLPLLTAPALVAFLTGAGHMLANKFPNDFIPLLNTMKNDVLHRLDESSVGVPSATRLKKVLEDVGLDGMKKDLPQGAVEGLYDGKGGNDSTSGLSAAPSSSVPSPFGQAAPAPTSSPFGQQSTSTGGDNSSGFNAGGSQFSSSTPFGSTPTAPMDNTSSTSSFGGGGFGSTGK